ncbi:13506_t:CDS:2 [Funneliformis mosseae]|uniref:13506_t:CDS:1 n=1 Tax=Funneliformis mosseae TaxID=27381 RepID=A0A9N9HB06_FUNMO|nr:13506_t:CDS:2 [Funneliformis mosseae]
MSMPVEINDLLLKLFEDQEILLIKNNSAYHSPEISETDEENLSDRRKIIKKDLR